MTGRYYIAIFILSLTFFSCQEQGDTKLFKKVDPKFSNVYFKNLLVETPALNILTYLYYYNGSGLTTADYNNDGYNDLYFTSNQGADRLYLNLGGFRFREITDLANIDNAKGWSTGVTHVDVNNDGLMDIYVCKVGGYKSLVGKNLLYLNLGNDQDGIPRFRESAEEYGLDFSGFSTHASFFDYDLDGDLDMYLLNHSVYPNRTFGTGSKRKGTDVLAGDRLFKNDNGKFVDITKTAGIFQGSIGYGLGLGISDLNNDGYPDIYVGNDFFENDYLYLNRKNGTFSDIISEDGHRLGHTTHFSMGNDLADINNDGWVDIVSLDMLPEDLITYKTSGAELPYPNYQYYLKKGYAPQYMQNTLHLNLGNMYFSEIGNLSGISASEWSWSALVEDYDNDGQNDLFITNGIKGATNDMDFINYIVEDSIQRKIEGGMSESDMAFIEKLPEKKVPNYFFKNNGNLTFSDITEQWFENDMTFSNGAVYNDLDNDGDLDLVINNLNGPVDILENTGNQGNYLKIRFSGSPHNRCGIGAKVLVYSQNHTIVKENFVGRGYLSAVAPELLFGLAQDTLIDSLRVVWPGGRTQVLEQVGCNQTLELDFKDSAMGVGMANFERRSYFKKIDSVLIFDHGDDDTVEFIRDPLIPFANTNEGPEMSVADINGDGIEDLFICGAKNQASALFVQDSLGKFRRSQEALFHESIKNEDVTSTFFDADNDGDPDLFVASGGNEFKIGEPLLPRLYINNDGHFERRKNAFAEFFCNASKINAVDIDNDGDMDISIFCDQIPWVFGSTPMHYILENDGKGFFTDIAPKIAPELSKIGGVKDAVWKDLDDNGTFDLVLAGHWIPIQIFMNNGNRLKKASGNGLQHSNGWWNTVKVEDLDNDGDLDIVAGNWGSNSRFKASPKEPVRLYASDFDKNGTIDPVVTYFHGAMETPFATKDELAKKLPYLNKKFLFYKDFANASIEGLFGTENLKNADLKEVYELKSTVFINEGEGNFRASHLPVLAQNSSVQEILVEDLDGDRYPELVLVGNNFEISTQLGRLDASHGIILHNDRTGNFTLHDQPLYISGGARSIAKINIKKKPHIAIGINKEQVVILKKEDD